MKRFATALAVLAAVACALTSPAFERNEAAASRPAVLTSKTLGNPNAYIPPQCYAKTESTVDGRAHNPCFTCHTVPMRPNFTNDADLQLAYEFTEVAETNRWKNLFRDRSREIAAISDAEVRDYISHSNYFDDDGTIALRRKLAKVPKEWDFDGNGRWDGFVPDVWFDFDDKGFDRDPAGHYDGWRAFAYYPFPGAFWPTNGSIGDVLIRLPEAFRTGIDGKPDPSVYETNLAIVEAMFRERDVAIDPVDEAELGNVDLDKDGRIATARKVAYDWAPREQRFMSYVGRAGTLQKAGELHLAAGLFPEGTEFFHTVRYVDVDDGGDNHLSARMKEVRYARKRFWVDYSKLRQKADGEFKEKRDFPNRVKSVRGNMEAGVSNGQAWAYAGFIEDARGELRPQTYEELVSCIGCHGGIGGNRDGIFSFARKLRDDAWRGGWYHWSQKGLRGVPERRDGLGRYEYSFYLSQNGAGDEFRENEEIRDRFFERDGRIRDAEVERLHTDVSRLLFASKSRAMALDKAYLAIVREQSYIEGRSPVLSAVHNAHRTIESGTSTRIETIAISR